MSTTEESPFKVKDYRVFSVYGLYLYCVTVFGRMQLTALVNHPSVVLPPHIKAQYQSNGGLITLKIDPQAAQNFTFDPYDDVISFQTRFAGTPVQVRMSTDAIMGFSDATSSHSHVACPQPSNWLINESKRQQAQRLSEPEPPREFNNAWTAETQATDLVEPAPPPPPKKGSHLRVVK